MTEREKALEAALRLARRMVDEALPKFNWGNSFLDANAIQLLNEAPIVINAALALPASIDRASWEAGRDASRKAVRDYLNGITDYAVSGRDQAGLDAAILSLTPPEEAPAPWTPPKDRPDGYRCWTWWNAEWLRCKWSQGFDENGAPSEMAWWVYGFGWVHDEYLKHFLPEPPAPEEQP